MREKLGQHFLINQSAIQKIIAALNLQKNDVIIEIGPGEGALTFPLLEQCKEINCEIIAIEKDPELAKNLESRITNQELRIIEGDVLKILPTLTKRSTLTAKRYKIVGNIPYYITGKLLRILSELITNYKLSITNVVLTVQKEVAERICAHPTKANPTQRKSSLWGMNLLAAAVQFWAEPKIIGYLKPEDFSPPPEVESAIILIATRARPLATRETLENYYRLIKIIFKQPRKTLLNNLAAGFAIGGTSPSTKLGTSGKIKKDKIAEILKSVGLKGNERPQDLNLEVIKKLASWG